MSPMGRTLLAIGGVVALLGMWNAPVTYPVYTALADEDTVSVIAHRRWLVSPSEIVFDLRGVTPEASMAKVDRTLFLAAHALKDKRFDAVALAWKGDTRFLLAGERFQTIGQEWPAQNPIYVIRTLQEDLATPDGQPAFGVWTGGWLGVMGKQMEDHNKFHHQWWLDDLASAAAANQDVP